MIHKTFPQTDKGQIARVTFTLPVGTWADAIYLVGEFNNWNESSHPFQRNREGAWIITVDLELGRSYQFRYRRDGEWMNDNQADAYVQNPYGSDNFVVITDPPLHQHKEEKE
ncbi:MAG TPA: isoamylase early set domain-containing protein [Ktedonobacteraceae bacterium]|nr:isoamylase early set domain-containing protein [Ktedonobacteraceae bacterium]